MAPVVLRSTLIDAVRDYGHLEHLEHITDPQIARRLDRSYRRLRALLDQARGHELEKTTTKLHVGTDSIDANGDALVELPADFHQLRGLLVQTSYQLTGEIIGYPWVGTGDFYEVLEFSERDRVELKNNTSPDICSYRYRLRAVEVGQDGEPRDQIEILPLPTQDLLLTVFYLPCLTLDPFGEEQDVYYQGVKGVGEEWLICDVLETCLAKSKEDLAAVRARKAEVGAQLEAQATDRDAAQPARIRQVWHRTDAGRPRDSYPWRGGPSWLRGR